MARYIDADVAIKEYTNAFTNAFGKSAGEMFKGVISQISTAYDVEKVVEELESLRIDKSNYFGVLNVVAEKYDRANEMLNDAIDIVRKGGYIFKKVGGVE